MGLLQSISVLNKNVRKTKAVCVCACVWSCMFLICPLTPASHAEHTVCTCSFFSCFFPSACRSLSAALLRVTMIMAGAVCGQMLPVVVKAQTISRSDGFLFLPLSLSLSFCVPLIVVLAEKVKNEEWKQRDQWTYGKKIPLKKGKDGEMNGGQWGKSERRVTRAYTAKSKEKHWQIHLKQTTGPQNTL